MAPPLLLPLPIRPLRSARPVSRSVSWPCLPPSFPKRRRLPASLRVQCLADAETGPGGSAPPPAPRWHAALAAAAGMHPAYVTAGAAVAVATPEAFRWFVDMAPGSYTAALGFIMLAMGLTLQLRDFAALLRERPLAMLFGCAMQYTIMPALGTIISRALGLSPSFSAGLVLLGCCPGGTASNVVTLVAKGDVPLSIVMTVCSTLAAVFLTPLLTKILAGAYIPVDAVKLSLSTLQVVVAPILLGSSVQTAFPSVVRVFSENFVRLRSTIADASSVNGSFFSGDIGVVMLSVFLLHFAGFFVGYAAAAVGGFKEKQRRAISIETVAKAVKAQYQFRFADEVDEDPMELDEVDNFDSRSGWGYTKFVKREEFEASEHLKDDSFAVRCNIILVSEFQAEEISPAIVEVPPSDIQRHLADLLQAGRGADVVFNVGGVAFTAHRWMLAARSAVFNAELFGMMKESDTRGVVHIHDMEPRVFKALLYFVYTDLFLDMTGEEDGDAMVQHLLVAADRYSLERLKLMCEEKLCKHIDLVSVATILTLADQHHCCGLKKSCFDFLSSRENLRAFVASDSFQHLSTSCPSIIKELLLSFQR
nr:unnamed protein product [Digitaria exilis]